MPTEAVRRPEEWTEYRAPRVPALTPTPVFPMFRRTPPPRLTLLRKRRAIASLHGVAAAHHRPRCAQTRHCTGLENVGIAGDIRRPRKRGDDYLQLRSARVAGGVE